MDKLFVIALAWLLGIAGLAAQPSQRIYVVSRGWHTGIVVPRASLNDEGFPGLDNFDAWEHVEIGWGDEGFYRAGDSISLGLALKAVATPTPTLLEITGVGAAVEESYRYDETPLVAIDLKAEEFRDLISFIRGCFALNSAGGLIDLGPGINSDSQFFRAHGSYYFPNTCNVWTVEALKAAGLPVFPAAGIRAENVMNQAAKHGTTIHALPERSHKPVVMGALVALAAMFVLRKQARLVPMAWILLILAVAALAGLTMMGINRVEVSDWLSDLATWGCWAGIALVAMVHARALSVRFRWWHVVLATVAGLAMVIGLSPL